MLEDKGPLDALEICNKIRDENFECLFVGAMRDKKFKRRWTELKDGYSLDKKCTYLGPKYGEDKKNILKKADFLLFPTKDERFPLVILEAFMYGIPVLSYDVGAIRKMVSKNYLGSVVKVNDWEKLSESLKKRLLENSESEKIRENFKRNYQLGKIMKKLIRIIEENL